MGVDASSGRKPLTMSTFSRISKVAKSMSVPKLKTTTTIEEPSEVID
jgi:hypothetical protein